MAGAMNRQQLHRAIAQRSKPTATQFTERQSEHFLELLLKILTEELSRQGGRITLSNFGILEVVERRTQGGKLRIGNSDQYAVVPPTRHIIRWKPSRKLKGRLRKNTGIKMGKSE